MEKHELQVIWNHLDDACGSLDNALMALEDWDEMPKEVSDAMKRVDFSALVILKNHIESRLGVLAIKSVVRGWECEGCKINRNTVEEVHRDCVCGNDEMIDLVGLLNNTYWTGFWSMDND